MSGFEKVIVFLSLRRKKNGFCIDNSSFMPGLIDFFLDLISILGRNIL